MKLKTLNFQIITKMENKNETSNKDNNSALHKTDVSGCSYPKIILHLCADLGSDSLFYQLSDEYEVIMIGEDVGVENYTPPPNVYGIIANPAEHIERISASHFILSFAHCISGIKSTADLCKKARDGFGLHGLT